MPDIHDQTTSCYRLPSPTFTKCRACASQRSCGKRRGPGSHRPALTFTFFGNERRPCQRCLTCSLTLGRLIKLVVHILYGRAAFRQRIDKPHANCAERRLDPTMFWEKNVEEPTRSAPSDSGFKRLKVPLSLQWFCGALAKTSTARACVQQREKRRVAGIVERSAVKGWLMRRRRRPVQATCR